MRSIIVLLLIAAAHSSAQIVPYVEALVKQGRLTDAQTLTARYQSQYGATPEALAALSWLARGEMNAHSYDQAINDSEHVRTLVNSALTLQKLDSSPFLSLALGATFEVQAQCLVAQNRRSEALQLLASAEKEYRGTSIQQRLHKNILLLTLAGHPLPAIHGLPNTWTGKPVLLFFWAHWCPDCKAMAPIIARLAGEFEPKGLVVLAPTRYYGYTSEKDQVTPAEEKGVIAQVFERYYAAIPHVLVPNDAGNFDRFGASTTPTIVVANRRGIVTLYHPGALPEQSLREALQKVAVER